jgi:hypothetical protein
LVFRLLQINSTSFDAPPEPKDLENLDRSISFPG